MPKFLEVCNPGSNVTEVNKIVTSRNLISTIRLVAADNGKERYWKPQKIAASIVPNPPGSGSKKARRTSTNSRRKFVELKGISIKFSNNQSSASIHVHPRKDKPIAIPKYFLLCVNAA